MQAREKQAYDRAISLQHKFLCVAKHRNGGFWGFLYTWTYNKQLVNLFHRSSQFFQCNL